MRLRKLHKEKNIILQQLSADTDISSGYISMMEQGQGNPTLGSLQRLCAALHIMLIDLLDNSTTGANSVQVKDRRPLECVSVDTLPPAMSLSQAKTSALYVVVYPFQQ